MRNAAAGLAGCSLVGSNAVDIAVVAAATAAEDGNPAAASCGVVGTAVEEEGEDGIPVEASCGLVVGSAVDEGEEDEIPLPASCSPSAGTAVDGADRVSASCDDAVAAAAAFRGPSSSSYSARDNSAGTGSVAEEDVEMVSMAAPWEGRCLGSHRTPAAGFAVWSEVEEGIRHSLVSADYWVASALLSVVGDVDLWVVVTFCALEGVFRPLLEE